MCFVVIVSGVWLVVSMCRLVVVEMRNVISLVTVSMRCL